jgi:ribosomal protein S18 acetylase RimI-like enzyme
MDVRPATREDVAAIEAVARAAFEAAYGFLAHETREALLAAAYDPAHLRELVTREDAHLLVADADEVIGFALARQEWADELALLRLYVHPDHWGEGAGSALLDAVAAVAADREVARVRARVLAKNYVARPFFESRGFERRESGVVELGSETHEELAYERPISTETKP